jgi:hypothetical protein
VVPEADGVLGPESDPRGSEQAGLGLESLDEEPADPSVAQPLGDAEDAQAHGAVFFPEGQGAAHSLALFNGHEH